MAADQDYPPTVSPLGQATMVLSSIGFPVLVCIWLQREAFDDEELESRIGQSVSSQSPKSYTQLITKSRVIGSHVWLSHVANASVIHAMPWLLQPTRHRDHYSYWRG